MNEEEQKWECEYCTYKNWPSSVKCVMCYGLKAAALIKSDGLTTDIYQLSNKISKLTTAAADPRNGRDLAHSILASENISRSSSPVEPLVKWSCSSCMHLNWPKTMRCVQCHTVRPKYSASATNDDKVTHYPSYSTKKWTCTACTYENWPKATKCVLCFVPRPPTTRGNRATSSPSREGNYEEETNQNSTVESSGSQGGSKKVLRAPAIHDNENIIGASAFPLSSNNYENVCQIEN